MIWVEHLDPTILDTKYISGLFSYMSQFFFQNNFEDFFFVTHNWNTPD